MATRKFAKIIAVCVIAVFLISLLPNALLLGSGNFNVASATVSASATVATTSGGTLNFGSMYTDNSTANSTLNIQGNEIVTSSGEEIILHSVNVVEMADEPDGVWDGVSSFTSEAQFNSSVLAQLEIMQSWGINTVRLLVNAEDWINNATSASISGDPNTEPVPYQTAVEIVCQDAQSLGMYVDVCNYRLSDYWTNNEESIQDPLPFSPYSLSYTSYIYTIADFVAFVQNEAYILKAYPNVMIELWNEPNTDLSSSAQADWYQAIQESIPAMRAVGYSQPIVVQCEVDSWCTAPTDTTDDHTNLSLWVNALGLNDTNIIYGTHLYRTYSAFGVSPQCYSYSDVYNSMVTEGIIQVAQEHPVYLSETGVNLDSDVANEVTAEQNLFSIAIANHISVGQHWFRDIGIFAMCDSSLNPTQGGQVFINAFSSNLTGEYGTIANNRTNNNNSNNNTNNNNSNNNTNNNNSNNNTNNNNSSDSNSGNNGATNSSDNSASANTNNNSIIAGTRELLNILTRNSTITLIVGFGLSALFVGTAFAFIWKKNKMRKKLPYEKKKQTKLTSFF